MRRFYALILALFLLLSGCTFPGQSSADKESALSDSRSLNTMDTIMKLTAYGKNRKAALDAGEAEILRLNDLLSIGNPESEVCSLNKNGSGILSEDAKVLVEGALSLYESTGGAFDITVYPLTELWGFPSKDYRVPSRNEIDALLPSIDAGKIRYNPNTAELILGDKQSIDLGGIAKGYTSQRLMEIFKENGVTSAIVSLGGNVQCLGRKPDGSPWRVGIQDPWKQNSGIAAVVQIIDEAVITSGGYERYFEDPETGHIYRHILDTKTGYPAESGLASVSIVSPNGTLADGLSTALYVMGLEKGGEYWKNHSDEFQVIFISDDGELTVSEGLAGRIQSDSEINILYK